MIIWMKLNRIVFDKYLYILYTFLHKYIYYKLAMIITYNENNNL